MKRTNIFIPMLFMVFLWIAANVLYLHFNYQHERDRYYGGKSVSTWSKGKRNNIGRRFRIQYRNDAQLFFIKSSFCLAFSLLFLAVSRTRRDIPKFIINSYREIDLKECVNIFKTKIRANKRFLFTALALFALFFVVYLSISVMLAKTSAFKYDNSLFEGDTIRVINDITHPHAKHSRTSVHPLFVLLLNPWGDLLKHIVGSDILAAATINSLLGAIAPCLALAFFFLVSGNYTASLLLAGVFGFSMSQLFHSTVPDTATLSICSLLITYILFLISLQGKHVWFVLWIAAGLLSLGATISNFMQTLICFGLSAIIIQKDKKESALAKISVFVVMVIPIVTLLSIIQNHLYYSRRYYLPSSFKREFLYTSFIILKRPLYVLGEIAKHFFLVNIVGPSPNPFDMKFIHKTFKAVTFIGPLNYTLIGWLGAGLWIGILAIGIVKIFADKQKHTRLYVGIALCLLFNIVLHTFYGLGAESNNELFCYTGNFTFLIISFLSNYSTSKKLSIGISLALLIALMGCNNLFVMRQILAVYR